MTPLGSFLIGLLIGVLIAPGLPPLNPTTVLAALVVIVVIMFIDLSHRRR